MTAARRTTSRPPTLIGGLPPSRLRVFYCIDWISLTLKSYDKNPSGGAFRELDPRYTEGQGMHGYNRSRKYADGRQLLWNNQRQDMGYHWVFSGSTLTNLAERGLVPYILLREFLDAGASISRLDLALDVYDSDLKLEALELAIERGEQESTSRKFSRVKGIGENEGFTLYVGSRQSTIYARLYDKAQERGEAGDWKRLELELKAGRADTIARKIAIEGMRTLTAIIPGLLRGLIDFPTVPLWGEILKAEKQYTPQSQKKQSNTMRWLISQCAPSLAREMLTKGNSEPMDDFIQAVHDRLLELKSEIMDDSEISHSGELPP